MSKLKAVILSILLSTVFIVHAQSDSLDVVVVSDTIPADTINIAITDTVDPETPEVVAEIIPEEIEEEVTIDESLYRAIPITFSDSINKSWQTLWVIHIPEVELNKMQRVWSRKIKNKTKSKVEESGHHFNINNTIISAISDKPVQVESIVKKTDNGVLIAALYKDSTTVFGREHKKQVLKFMRPIAVDEYTEVVEEQIEEAELTLKERELELKQLKKMHERMHKQIIDNNADINHAEIVIKDNDLDKERLTELINERKDIMITMPDKKTRKDYKRDIKKLEKDREDLYDDNTKLRKDIFDWKYEIEILEKQIPENEEAQHKKLREIEKQKLIIKALKKKKKDIGVVEE